MNYKKLLINTVGFLILVGGLVVPLLPAPVSAAPSGGEWISQTQISYNGKTFTDTDIDHTWEFHDNNDKTCDNIIHDFDGGEVSGLGSNNTIEKNPTGGYYLERSEDPATGACKPSKSTKGVHITLSSVENSKANLQWQDASTITTVASFGSKQAATYLKNDNDGLFYEQGGDKCKDTLQIATGSTNGTLIVRTANDGDTGTSFQNPNLWVSQALLDHGGNGKLTDGCLVYNPISVTVSNYGNTSAKDAGSSTAATDANGTSDDSAPALDCGGGSLNWLACPVTTFLQGLANRLDSFITSQLEVNSASIFDSAGYHTAWNSFRIIATALLVIAGLVMVASQAFGLEILDAYTIRKVLPRLLIAVIGISLSWPILQFVIDFFNTLGVDIRNLIYAPFSALGADAGHTGAFITFNWVLAPLVVAGAFVIYGPAILTVLLTGCLALFLAFLVLVVRQIGVALLIIAAPVAIACFILPNTQKVWKLWKDNFLGLMFMFPIIMAIIAAGHVFAAVSRGGDDAGVVQQFIGLIAYFIPYFMLPFAFRLATGVIGTLAGIVNDRGKGAFDRLKGMRGNAAERNMHDLKTGNRFKGDGRIASRMNRTTSTIAALPQAGMNPKRMSSRLQTAMSRHSMEEAAEFAEKDSAFNAIKQNDDLLMAGLHGQGNEAKTRQYLMSRGISGAALEQSVAAIRAARRSGPSEVFDIAAALSLPATGTAFKGGAGEMHDVINEVAGDDRLKAARMLGAMRSGASSARRFDISGGGFGDELKTLEAQYEGKMTTDQANVLTARQALEGQGGSYIAGSRKGAVSNFTKPMLDKLDEAVKSGDKVALASELAKLAGRYDALSQVAPENAEQIATQVMGQSLLSVKGSPFAQTFTNSDDGSQMTVREMIETFRGDPTFLDRRKEWGQATRSNAALAQQAAQQAAQSAGQVQPPINPGPMPPMPG